MIQMFHHRHRYHRRCAALWLLLLALPLRAELRFPTPPADQDLIGTLERVPARAEETLLDIARRHHLGQDEILLANPEVDRWLPGEGTEVLLPTRFILPRAERRGLVLNLPEMRIYHFRDSDRWQSAEVATYPVSVGRMDWETPQGETRITAKQQDPAWYPPQSIREEAAERGETLPEVVPAGPQNPLGRHALRLGIPGYLIHGTNKPWGVGMRVTHGCLRLYPEHVERLFEAVPVGTAVQIVDQPIKVGWHLGALYMEVHPPLEETAPDPALLAERALDLIHAASSGRGLRLDGAQVRAALAAQAGVPVRISLETEPETGTGTETGTETETETGIQTGIQTGTEPEPAGLPD